MKRIEYLIKHNSLFQKTYKLVFSSVLRFIGLFIKVDNKTILFTGHNGGFNDSPKMIYEELLNDKTYSNYRMIWGLSDTINIDKKIKDFVKIYSFKYFIISLKSKYWVASVNIERGLNYKKKSTKYINTWHGIPIKKIGNAAFGRKDFNFSKIDYFVISSEYERDIYIRDFKINSKSCILTGMPRNQTLFTNILQSEKEKICETLGINPSKKIILYAPTWRDSTNNGKSYDLRPPINFKKWINELSDDYIILLRAHPYTTQLLVNDKDKYFVDVSQYKSVNDLIQIADYLISDYSAIFFDYAITGKPMYCFAYDLEEYSKTRGLYMDLEKEFPGGVCFDENTIISRIKTDDLTRLTEEVNKFKNKYIMTGENSTQECIKFLFLGGSI